MTLTVTQYESSANLLTFIESATHSTSIKKMIFKLQTFIEIIVFRLVMPKRRISIMDVALFLHYEKKESCTLNSAKFALFFHFISVEEVKIWYHLYVHACARIIISQKKNSIIAAYYLLFGKSRFQLISTFWMKIYRHAFFGCFNIVDSIKTFL